MKDKPTTYRFTRLTLEQIDKLTESTGHSKANVIATAIDRMYREEMKNMNTKTTVINSNGKAIDYNAAVNMMDDDIRERLHMKDWESAQDFFAAYEQAHANKFKEEWELSKANPVW